MPQRVMIAMALAAEPEVVIIDEPTTALDVVVQREILAEIFELKDALGFSVLFITHDLSLLLEIADRVVIMYAGQVVESGTREEIHTRAAHPGRLPVRPPVRLRDRRVQDGRHGVERGGARSPECVPVRQRGAGAER